MREPQLRVEPARVVAIFCREIAQCDLLRGEALEHGGTGFVTRFPRGLRRSFERADALPILLHPSPPNTSKQQRPNQQRAPGHFATRIVAMMGR